MTLKDTSWYRALLGETRTTFENRSFVPTSRFSGLAAAVREHFGGRQGPYALGTSLAMIYYQRKLETN